MSIITTIITKIVKQDKDKSGEPYKSKKTGKPFWRIAIKTDKTGDEWYSTVSNLPDSKEMQLTEGMDVTIDISESNGFKNFRLPTALDFLEHRVTNIEKFLKENVKVEKKVVYPKDYPEPTEDNSGPLDW